MSEGSRVANAARHLHDAYAHEALDLQTSERSMAPCRQRHASPIRAPKRTCEHRQRGKRRAHAGHTHGTREAHARHTRGTREAQAALGAPASHEGQEPTSNACAPQEAAASACAREERPSTPVQSKHASQHAARARVWRAARASCLLGRELIEFTAVALRQLAVLRSIPSRGTRVNHARRLGAWQSCAQRRTSLRPAPTVRSAAACAARVCCCTFGAILPRRGRRQRHHRRR